MINFHVVKTQNELTHLARKALSDSNYAEHPDLDITQLRYMLPEDNPVLVYVCIDIRTVKHSVMQDKLCQIPFVSYHTLSRQLAKKLVYFRIKRQEPIRLSHQLILNSDILTAFASKLRHRVETQYAASREMLRYAIKKHELNMRNIKAALYEHNRIFCDTLFRKFEYVSNNGVSKGYSIPYAVYIDPATASDYVHITKNRRLSAKDKGNEKLDTFQSHIHPIFDIRSRGNGKKCQRRER